MESVRKFNYKCKAGLKLMVETNLIQPDDPVSLVTFIRKQHDNIDKEKLGGFLGDADDYNNKSLLLFTDSLSFKDMNIDEAMRYYLSQFMLPGEGQQIDRVVQQFGMKYHRDCSLSNPFIASGDSAYSLSYLLITL